MFDVNTDKLDWHIIANLVDNLKDTNHAISKYIVISASFTSDKDDKDWVFSNANTDLAKQIMQLQTTCDKVLSQLKDDHI